MKKKEVLEKIGNAFRKNEDKLTYYRYDYIDEHGSKEYQNVYFIDDEVVMLSF